MPRQHIGGLGELDVVIADDLDGVAPRIARKSRNRPGGASSAGLGHAAARTRLFIVDHQAEVAAVSSGALGAALLQGDELVAQVDERHAGGSAAQLEVDRSRKTPAPGQCSPTSSATWIEAHGHWLSSYARHRRLLVGFRWPKDIGTDGSNARRRRDICWESFSLESAGSGPASCSGRRVEQPQGGPGRRRARRRRERGRTEKGLGAWPWRGLPIGARPLLITRRHLAACTAIRGTFYAFLALAQTRAPPPSAPTCSSNTARRTPTAPFRRSMRC